MFWRMSCERVFVSELFQAEITTNLELKVTCESLVRRVFACYGRQVRFAFLVTVAKVAFYNICGFSFEKKTVTAFWFPLTEN